MTTRLLLRGGCVLTLGAKTPNFSQADLLIDDGRVAEVGLGLRSRDAEVVDATDTIVMPGFVDAHRHTWTSLFRNIGGQPADGEGPTPGGFSGNDHRPEDVYAATLIGLLGAVEAGITTVVDWADVHLDGDAADAALQAHTDAGLRTVFAHAVRHGRQGDADARQRHTRLTGAAGPSTTIAVGLDARAQAGPAGIAGDWALARELGSRIHVHTGGEASAHRVITDSATQGLLGADVTLVHCSGLQDADLDAVAASGAAVSLSPSSEMAGGLGPPPIQQLIDRSIRPGLGIDDERVAPGDMFAQMRATISLQHATVFDRKLAGKAALPRLMSTRDVIRYATVDGARVAGLDRLTGSLEPGKQADLVVLRTDRPNIFPVNDPIGAVVWGMDTSNVDWVIVGGRILMRGGVLDADVPAARSLAAAARQRVATSGLAVGATPGGEG